MSSSAPKVPDSSLPTAPKNRAYSREFKLNAVRMITEKGISYNQLSRQLGVSKPTLRLWVKQLSTPADPLVSNQDSPLLKENRMLRNELLRVREDNEFLKKATRYFAQTCA